MSWYIIADKEYAANLVENESCPLLTKTHEFFQIFATKHSEYEYSYHRYFLTYAMTCPVGFRGFDAMMTASPWVRISFYW